MTETLKDMTFSPEGTSTPRTVIKIDFGDPEQVGKVIDHLLTLAGDDNYSDQIRNTASGLFLKMRLGNSENLYILELHNLLTMTDFQNNNSGE